MDDRLTACAELCCGKVLCDVGTDHGYLPCYMIEKGLCTKAYACDIAPGPLSSAIEHNSRRGLEDKITPILSDGLVRASSANLRRHFEDAGGSLLPKFQTC